MGVCISGLIAYTYNRIIDDLRRRYDDIKKLDANTSADADTDTNTSTDWEIVIHD